MAYFRRRSHATGTMSALALAFATSALASVSGWTGACAAQPADHAPAIPATKRVAVAKATNPAGAARSASNEKPAQSSGSGQSIVVLVNDEPITGYEIEQRQHFMALGANIHGRAEQRFKDLIKSESTSNRLKAILKETIDGNKGKTRDQIIALFEERKKQFALSLQKQAVESARQGVLPGLRKNALEELIDERLKLQEAKRLNLVAGDDEVNRIIKGMAERNKVSEQQFADQMRSQGADISTLKARFRATLSWNEVIRRKFGHQVAITESDVDRFVASAASGEDEVDLQVQRITLAVPAKLDQKLMAERLAEADRLRGKFAGCPSTAKLATEVSGATFEDLGTRKPASIPEPTRSFLLSAKDGEMLPPSVGQGGIELWAVCGRQTTKSDDKKRSAAQEELRQREFELLAKRHLKDLRQDAHIEYR